MAMTPHRQPGLTIPRGHSHGQHLLGLSAILAERDHANDLDAHLGVLAGSRAGHLAARGPRAGHRLGWLRCVPLQRGPGLVTVPASRCWPRLHAPSLEEEVDSLRRHTDVVQLQHLLDLAEAQPSPAQLHNPPLGTVIQPAHPSWHSSSPGTYMPGVQAPQGCWQLLWQHQALGGNLHSVTALPSECQPQLCVCMAPYLAPSSDPAPSGRGGGCSSSHHSNKRGQNLCLTHTEPPQSGSANLVPWSDKGTEDGNRPGSAQCPKLDIDSTLPAAH